MKWVWFVDHLSVYNSSRKFQPLFHSKIGSNLNFLINYNTKWMNIETICCKHALYHERFVAKWFWFILEVSLVRSSKILKFDFLHKATSSPWFHDSVIYLPKQSIETWNNPKKMKNLIFQISRIFWNLPILMI